MNPVLLPAVGALFVLAFDLLGRSEAEAELDARGAALSGIRLGSVAVLSLVAVLFLLRGVTARTDGGLLDVDAFGALGTFLIAISAFLVVNLSLTHFGMDRSRAAEPLALLLFAWSGAMAAVVSENLIVLLVAFELAWLPVIALIAIDSRRLSSSESSLKAFFAHGFASLIFAQGVALVFGASGSVEFAALSPSGSTATEGEPSLLFQVGMTLVFVGVLARAVVAPFHPWSPDVHEGAPSFVTAHLATVAQIASFFVLLRMLHGMPAVETSAFAARIPMLITILGCAGLLFGHAMALVQVRLRRLVGWLGVGQAGFFALALVEGRGAGGPALVISLIAASVATTGVMAILSSLSHHERACENIGDLAGMMERSPIRATLFAVFLLSLAGMPGTIGFVARFETLSALESAGHRTAMFIGLVATMGALSAVGRPLLAMLTPAVERPDGSRALTNEQFVLAACGAIVVFFGIAPLVGEATLSGSLTEWIDRALVSLRGTAG